MAKDAKSDRRVARHIFRCATTGVSPEKLKDMLEDGVYHLAGGHVQRRRREFARGAAQMDGEKTVMLTSEQQQAQSAERAAAEVATAKNNPETAARIEKMMQISMGLKPASAPRQEP